MAAIPDSPAALLRHAAKLMRERATAATPGPWERPLDTRHKNSVMAALPEGEQGSYVDGTIPAAFGSHKGPSGRYAGRRERCSVVSCSTWSDGSFSRKRSGRDLDYIASMHPGVALTVADWLDETAKAAADALSRDFAECVHDEPCHCDHPPFFTCDRCYGCLGADCNCWDKPLAVATAVIGVTHGS